VSLPRLRWVIFVRSIVAVDEHPPALVFRLLARSLARHQQEAVLLEERANPLTVAALHRHGAAVSRELATAWPDVQYQTVEQRTGADLVEWLGRTLATADLALVELGVREELAYWVGQLTRPHLKTFLLDLMPDEPALAAMRQRLDPATFTGIICHPANAPAYRGRTSARQIVLVEGEPTELASAIADAVVALLFHSLGNLETRGQAPNGSGPATDQPEKGSRG
jgi:hypothetical protein